MMARALVLACAALVLALVLSPGAAAQGPPGAAVEWEPWGFQDLGPPSLAFRADSVYVPVPVLSRRQISVADDWTEVSTQSSVGLLRSERVVFASDSVILVAVPGDVNRSADGGRTWTEDVLEGGVTALAAVAGHVSDTLVGGTPPAVTVLAGGDDAFTAPGAPDAEADVAVSYDGGATWPTRAPLRAPGETGSTLRRVFAFARFRAASPVPGRLVSAGTDGTFYSDDGGRTWTASALFGRLRYLAHSLCLSQAPVGHADHGAVFVSVIDGTRPLLLVLASHDGETWTERGEIDADRAYLACAPGGGLYAGIQEGNADRLGRFAYSADGGRTWTDASAGFPSGEEDTAVRALEVGPDGRLYAATYRGVWRTTAPVPVAAEAPPVSGAGASLAVWPNPAAGAATVSLTLPESAEQVRLVVYDVLGRAVALLHDGSFVAGAHEVLLDVSGLAPGAYVVRAEGLAAPPVRLTVLQ